MGNEAMIFEVLDDLRMIGVPAPPTFGELLSIATRAVIALGESEMRVTAAEQRLQRCEARLNLIEGMGGSVDGFKPGG